jgi:transposase, IS30 family
MTTTYKQLNSEERDKLAILKGQRKGVRAIARVLKRDPSTISRELKRNAPPIRSGYYLAHKAQARSADRRSLAVHRKRLKTPRIRAYVNRQLRRGWSPELIAGRLVSLGWKDHVSTEAIYQYVYSEARDLIPYLTRAHRKRRRRGYSRKHTKSHIPGRISISERPAVVASRKRWGDWEADTAISSKSRPVLQFIVNRRARYMLLNRLPCREASAMRKTMNRAMCRLPSRCRKTITYDNGVENVEHELVNRVLGTKSYFCNPYTSQEKGTVENIVGLVRRRFPKRTDFAMLPAAKIKWVERWINNRPMKILNYQTPAEVFRSGVALRG